MASKEEEPSDRKDTTCPPIKNNLKTPKSFDIRKCGNTPKVRFPQTHGGRAAPEIAYVTSTELPNGARKNTLRQSSAKENYKFELKERKTDNLKENEGDQIEQLKKESDAFTNKAPDNHSSNKGKSDESEAFGWGDSKVKTNIQPIQDSSIETLTTVPHERGSLVSDKITVHFESDNKTQMSDKDVGDDNTQFVHFTNRNQSFINCDNTKRSDPNTVEPTQMEGPRLDKDTKVIDDNRKTKYGHSDEIGTAKSTQKSDLMKPDGNKVSESEMTDGTVAPTNNMSTYNQRDSSEKQQTVQPWFQRTLKGRSVYLWTFAVSCKAIWEQIKTLFQENGYDIDFNDCLLVRCRTKEAQFDQREIQKLMDVSMQDLKYTEYTISNEIIEDVMAHIGYLRGRPITRMTPENPYKNNDAAVYKEESQLSGYWKVILVTRLFCFQNCSNEIGDIIIGCMKSTTTSEIDKCKCQVASIRMAPSQQKDTKQNRSLVVNCEQWKFKWVVKKEGGMDKIQEKFNVLLQFDDGKLRVSSETEDQLNDFREYFQKRSEHLAKEIKNIYTDLNEYLERAGDFSKNLGSFEEKYKVMIDISRLLDQLEDVQMEIDNIHVILTTDLKDESAMVVNLVSTSYGLEFHFLDEVLPLKHLKGVVQKVVQECADGVIAIQVDKSLEDVKGLASMLYDFIECLRGYVQRSSGFTVLILTYITRQFLCLKRMLERCVKPIVNESLGVSRYGSIAIRVIRGELAKQKVGVIVNSSNESLTLSQGAVSNSLLNVAGQKIQEEAWRRYPDGIRAGEIAETRGYGLNASCVFHTCLLNWNSHVQQKQEMCRKVLRSVIEKCLTYTNEHRLKSIAFPALGTGVLKFPDAVVAEDMISTVQQYSQNYPDTCIRNVLFVIYTKETELFKIFIDKLKEHSQPETDPEWDDDSEYCAVITGKKEDVLRAKSKLDCDLLTKYKTEISGYSQRIESLPKHEQKTIKASEIEDVANQTYERIRDVHPPFDMEASQYASKDNLTTFKDARLGLTSDKGAIPKAKTAANKKKELQDDSKSYINDGMRRLPNETIHEELREKKLLKVDTSVDEILDRYLENFTVTLNKEAVKSLGEIDHESLHKKIKRECNIDLVMKEQSVQGTAKDIAKASEVIIDIIETHEAQSELLSDRKTREELEDRSSDDLESAEEAFDSELEQNIFERTLSMRTQDLEKLCLKNIRKEVFLLFKMMYREKWQEISHVCKTTFLNGTVSLSIERKMTHYPFLKDTFDILGTYQYMELDSKLPLAELVETTDRVKKRDGKFDEIYIIEVGDTAMLAGRSYDLVDELRRLVEKTLVKGDQTAQNKRLLGRQLSRFDKTCDSSKKHLEPKSEEKEEQHKRMSRTIDGSSINDYKEFTTNKGIRIYVYRSSILRLDVDCIVNAANSNLDHGGGIAKVIAVAAGPSFVKECKDYIRTAGPLRVGTCCVTSAGQLHYKRVIHTVGPCMSDYKKNEMDIVQEDLYKAIYSVLDELKQLGYKSTGIPSVSTGIFGVPKKLCALQYCLAVRDFSLSQDESIVKEVHFIDIDDEMIEIIGLTCDIVFNDSDKAKHELKLISPKQKTSTKSRVRKMLHLPKNKRNSEQPITYPCVKDSFHTKLKIYLSQGFQVSVKLGNIVDFKKGIVVCCQDPELKCNSGVAKSIMKVDTMFKGNMHSRHHRKHYRVGDVLDYKSTSLGYEVYNIIVPHGMVDSDIISFCYSQVLEMACQKRAGGIALPLLVTGGKKQIKQIGRVLAELFIEMVNTKGRHYQFPAVYIYNNDKQNVKLISEALKEIILPLNEEDSPKSQNLFDRKKSFRFGISSRKSSRQSLEFVVSGRYAGTYADSDTKLTDDRINDPIRESKTDTNKPETSENGYSNDINPNINEGTNEENRELGIDDKTFSKSDERGKTDSLESMKCVICMDSLNDPKTLEKCGHTFCTDCINEYFKVKPVCPTCFTPYGILTGTQPQGEMRYFTERNTRLPGYEKCGAIKIQYNFPDGIQGEEHPNPGQPYTGTRRSAYLPDTKQGRDVCKMLKVAFDRKLVFTIGRSVTTGVENIVTWNDIHHKTNIFGGPAKYGFPDPDYLSRVTEELAAKGVTLADISP